MKHRPAACLLVIIAAQSGCFSARTTRLPELASRGSEYERRESQIQDPYPDKKMGPDMDFRPREFQEQRTEPQQAKDRSYSSFLRSRVGVSGVGGSAQPYYPPAGP